MTNRYAIRSTEIEIMDDLQSGGEAIKQTLRELETINKMLGGNYVTLQGIKQIIGTGDGRTWKILDLGCGGGDILKRIANWARKRAIKVELIGIDANPHVIEFATTNCTQFPEISFQCVNIFSDEFKRMDCDILTATLFLHHFKDEELVKLFSQFQEQASTGVVINDLHRHWLAYRSINLLTSLFSKSAMVRHDAGLSVLRAFRSSEIHTLMRFSRINSFKLRWMWAFRWQLLIDARKDAEDKTHLE